MYAFFLVIFQFLTLFCSVYPDQYQNTPNKYRLREGRTCNHKPYSALDPFYRKSIFENTTYLFFIILLGILFGLMVLGLIKGLVGVLCLKCVGEYGMSMLVDLPKPLDEYQEKELKGRTVCYDVAGWPVHPDTGERSVRILSLKTEFCLNLIFFLAYPLALILRLCSLCCCIKNGGDDDETCYKRVNIIRCKADKKNSRPEVDRYYDNDLREASDTHYVIQCMKESQLSLEKLHNSFS